jgi:hypothetical protein
MPCLEIGFQEMESGWCWWLSPRPLRWWTFHLLLPGHWVHFRGRQLWTQYFGVGPVMVALTDLSWEEVR